MHPAFAVYNPETVLELREHVGKNIGVNQGPSQLFWLGVDIPAAIRTQGPATLRFYGEDTFIGRHNVAENGCLMEKHTAKSGSVPGHSAASAGALCLVGAISPLLYFGMSIEHEDAIAVCE
jgi:hypothetical protein